VGAQLLRDGDSPAALELAVKSASPRSWAPTKATPVTPAIRGHECPYHELWERNFVGAQLLRDWQCKNAPLLYSNGAFY